MTISNDLFMAILAMDSYNRGYDIGVAVSGSSLGLADLGIADGEADAQDASFFAQSYLWNGQTVIAYRGTDTIPGSLADLPAFATGATFPDTDQTRLTTPVLGCVITRRRGVGPFRGSGL